MQNAEAAELLLNKVYPLIHQKNPNAKVLIVGQYIPENILSKNSDNIIIRNLKEDDQNGIRDAYYESSVFVSPLRGPGGTRLKHFAAMASKLPLITTSVGAEGLGVIDGLNVVIRNSPEEIAQATLKILSDFNLAKK